MTKPPQSWLPVLVIGVALAGCLARDQHESPAVRRSGPTPAPPPPAPPAPGPIPDPIPDRAAACAPARAAELIPLVTPATGGRWVSVAELEEAVASRCGGCHLAPAAKGNFSFVAALHGTGSTPGLAEAAAQMSAMLLNGKMPPPPLRAPDEATCETLGQQLAAYVAAGTPPDGFQDTSTTSATAAFAREPTTDGATTNLSSCVPAASAMGTDPDRDALFAAAQALPERLADTDLVSLDPFVLAGRGTVAYAPQYPLWADDARKIRFVHVPASADGRPDPIRFDAATGRFDIPENTRFYKTFYKRVVDAGGREGYRRVETRVIVVRKPWDRSLFGSYRWSEDGADARLVSAPYRDGTPFRDEVFDLEVDARTHATRTYAIPARHRCVQCHQGSQSASFILGFTPLQVNRRPQGQGGADSPVGEDELSQVARLTAYGVLSGVTPAAGLPNLESMRPDHPPRNAHELRAQAYLVGNCAHCHNRSGFATNQDPRLASLDLSAGGLFQFPTATRGVSSGNLLVSAGNPAGSELYQRISRPTQLVGLVALQHMPLHIPGMDCRLVDLVGRWISSIPILPSVSAPPEEVAAAQAAAEARAQAFTSSCTPPAAVTWQEQDFTEPQQYVPRRTDWNDPASGIPASIRALALDDTLRKIAETPIAVGYWNEKPGCSFPTVSAPPGGVRPWMLDATGKPKRPFGEVFYRTPGAHYFAITCQRCHGPHGDGQSGLANLLAQETGGTVRVANLRDGLFGRSGMNLSAFDLMSGGTTRNLAGNYLIWMAGGATKVMFPPGFGDLVGTNGANMLSTLRTEFARFLPNHPDPYPDYYQTYEIFQRVATAENPVTAAAGFQDDGETPVDADAQRAWLDRAQANAGWMLFRFFELGSLTSGAALDPNQCEKIYGTAPPPPPPM